MKKPIIIVTIKTWNIKNAKQFQAKYFKKREVFIFTSQTQLKYERVKNIDPEFIFFPHWSWKIPKAIYDNFKCIVFHMTDLPFGRGGSPLQNLIARKIYKTKISALGVSAKLDAGPVYLKRSLFLNGSADTIYKKASGIIFRSIIPYILKNNPIPKVQSGRVVIFKRRKPQDSRIPNSAGMATIFNYIRMLDAEGYPPAFIETKNLHFEFKRAKKNKNYIECIARITKRG